MGPDLGSYKITGRSVSRIKWVTLEILKGEIDPFIDHCTPPPPLFRRCELFTIFFWHLYLYFHTYSLTTQRKSLSDKSKKNTTYCRNSSVRIVIAYSHGCDVIWEKLAYGGANGVFLDQPFPCLYSEMFLNSAESKKNDFCKCSCVTKSPGSDQNARPLIRTCSFCSSRSWIFSDDVTYEVKGWHKCGCVFRKLMQREVPPAPTGHVCSPGGQIRGPDGIIHSSINTQGVREGTLGDTGVSPKNYGRTLSHKLVQSCIRE